MVSAKQNLQRRRAKLDYGGEDWGEVVDVDYDQYLYYTSPFRCRLFSTPEHVKIRAFMPNQWRNNPKFQHSKRK